MNTTNFEHAGYAILFQAVIGLLTGDWFAGGCFGYAFFLGREHHTYTMLNPGLPLWEQFYIWRWERDNRLDFVFPAVAVVAVLGIWYICEHLLTRGSP